jgi:hypothetical protein
MGTEHTNPETAERLNAVESRLADVLREERNILGALQLLLDGLAHQTELLTSLANLAKEEPETSQLSSTINRLTRAVLALEMVSQRLDKLPERIGAELEKQFGTAVGG